MIPNIPDRKPTMNRIETTTRIGIALALLGTPALLAQEPTDAPPLTGQQEDGEQEIKKEQKRDVPRLQEIRPDFGGGNDVQDEIRDLFIRVERNLLRMEDYLLDASAGDTSALEKVGPSGMDELLESAQPQSSPEASGVAGVLGRTRTHGQQVLEDIDRIIEIANEQGGSCSSSGGDKPSPLEGNQPGSTDRAQGQKPPSEDSSKTPTGEPEGNQDSPDPPSSSPTDRTPDQATAPPPPAVEDDERWGELPIYTRELFRAGGTRDLPPQYRDWIDAYYRRLNRRSDG